MSRFRDQWCADLFSCGLSSSSGEYTPQLSVKLRNPEREQGRVVHIPFSPESAERIGDLLKEYANRARELNAFKESQRDQ